MSDKSDLVRLLQARSIRRGDFVLASGARSSYYIDARLTTMSAEGLAVIGRLGLNAIRYAEWDVSAVGGLTMGADPVAYAIAAASVGQGAGQIDAFSVRKEVKEHGTGRRIEGNFSAGARVVVVEDVITSGGSARKAAESVVAEGGEVVGIIAVVDREEGGRAVLTDMGFKVVSLTTASELGVR